MTGFLIAGVALLGALDTAGQDVKSPNSNPERKPVSYWIEELKKPEAQARQAAASALRDYRSDAKVAVPALVGVLKDPDRQVRLNAVGSLWILGPAAEAALPALVEVAKDSKENSTLREAVIQVLDIIDKEEAIPTLIELLKSDAVLRPRVILALGHFGPRAKSAAPVLIETFQDAQTPYGDPPAVIALRRIGPEVLPAIRKALKDERPLVRIYAAKVLCDFEPKSVADAVEVVAKGFDDPNQAVRIHSSRLMLRLPPDPSMLEPLRRALKHKDDNVSSNAVYCLARLGRDAEPAIPDLIEYLHRRGRDETAITLREIGPKGELALAAALRDEKPHVRLFAAYGLTRSDRYAGEVERVLTELAKRGMYSGPIKAASVLSLGTSPGTSGLLVCSMEFASRGPGGGEVNRGQWAVRYLAYLGPRGRGSVPLLIEALQIPWFQTEAVGALAGIGPDAKAALPQLIELFNKGEHKQRQEVIYALTRIGFGKMDIPELVKLLRDQDVQRYAVDALVEMEKAAVPVLMEALKDKDQRTRQGALRALGRMGPAAKPALPLMMQALENVETCQVAEYALARLGPDAAPLLPVLIDRVKNPKPSPPSVISLAKVLQEMGPAAREAIPIFQRLLESEEYGVSDAAVAALARLGPEGQAVLSQALKGPNRVVRHRVVSVLTWSGPVARPLVPALCEVLKNPQEDLAIRRESVQALARLCTEADPPRPDVFPAVQHGVPALASVLKAANRELRVQAAASLGQIGHRARAAVPELKQALQDNDRRVQVVAAEALWLIEGSSDLVIPVLVAALDSDDQVLALRVLGKIGSKARVALPSMLALHRRHEDNRPGYHQEIGAAIKAVDPQFADSYGIK